MAREAASVVHSVGKYKCVFVPLRDGKHAGALYMREHVDRTAGADASRKGKMLFVGNLHPRATEEAVAGSFASYGGVADVKMGRHGEGPGGRFAVVTFRTEALVQSVLSGEKEIMPVELPEENAKAWLAEYREERASAAKLQEEVDAFMQQFDAEEARAEQEKRAAEEEVDEDGFRRVTYKRRRGAKQAETKLDMQESKRRRKERELKNFYSFQVRDSKKHQLARLRAQFEEDKRRVAVMKENRKFKPF